MERTDRRTSAQTCPGGGADGVDRRVAAQGRREDRLAEALAPARISDPSAALGGRTFSCLDLPQPKEELRDRERLCASGEAFMYAAVIPLMLR